MDQFLYRACCGPVTRESLGATGFTSQNRHFLLFASRQGRARRQEKVSCVRFRPCEEIEARDATLILQNGFFRKEQD